MEPRTGAIQYLLGASFHRMAYVEWGDPSAPVLLCVHALTRNGRDFDPLARALSDKFRTICPDLPGRGASDWLADGNLYQIPTYVQALSHLLAVIGKPMMFLGTSLGGICAMLLGAARGTPLTRIVVNDVGPHIPKAALARISAYLAPPDSPLTFPDLTALRLHLETIYRPFGTVTSEQWDHIARISARPFVEGRLALNYDPAIAAPLKAAEPADVDLWDAWNQIRMPALVVHGENSDLLLPDTFARMQRPGVEIITVAGAGHAPWLMDAETIGKIREFLTR